MDEWLTEVKQYLISVDPRLKPIFDTVNFQLHTVRKEPYVALVGAIIGQKITYTAAKELRGHLYKRFGDNFTPITLIKSDLFFLGTDRERIIKSVTQYIIDNNIDLNTEVGLRTLLIVPGIGPWTIETTLLTSFLNWDIFPLGDKFLKVRMKRLYGDANMEQISQKWAPFRSIVTWYLWRWF